MSLTRFEPANAEAGRLGTAERIVGEHIVRPFPFYLDNPTPEQLAEPDPLFAELGDPRVSVGEIMEVMGPIRGRKAIRDTVYHFAEQGVPGVTEYKVTAALLFYGRNKQAFTEGNPAASRRRSQMRLD
jgi:hypothetical protein